MLMTTPEYYDNGVCNEEKIAGYTANTLFNEIFDSKSSMKYSNSIS